jgi:general secretion pathway protein N
MNMRFRIRLLGGLCLAVQTASPSTAATRPETQLLDDSASVPPIELRPGFAAPPAVPTPAGRAGDAAGGNPLWAIPLSSLTATRERPLFTPSRRAPAPVMPNAPVAVVPVAPEAPPPMPETRVALILIGTIASEADGIALFTDPNTREVVRLRLGDVIAGWTLDTVRSREVTFKKGDRDDVLTIQTDQSATPAVATPEFIPNRPNGEVYN